MKKINLTYEEAIKELDDILYDLEQNTLTLKKTMEKFRRGIILYNYASNILNEMEGEIQILVPDHEGDLKEEDFNMEV